MFTDICRSSAQHREALAYKLGCVSKALIKSHCLGHFEVQSSLALIFSNLANVGANPISKHSTSRSPSFQLALT